jgi:hypothetical protein
MVRTSETNPVCLVHLVCFVYLVGLVYLARMIHEGSSRKRADATQDGHSEP